MHDLKLHKDFKLNGNSFKSEKELLRFAETISLSVVSFLDDWFSDSDYISIKTSGSTGTPKTIHLKKHYMITSALATGTFFKIFKGTNVLLCLSPDYITGKMMLVRALVLGWRLDCIEPRSNPLDGIKKKYDFCAMVPLQLENSLNKLHKVKKLIVGGATISNRLIQKLKGVSTEVYATYGMTETITHVAIKQLNHFQNITLSPPTGEVGAVERSYFRILPNIKISMDNRSCLIIDALKVCDKQIITNDIVELVSETEFKWLGRYDSIINSGGIKLLPEQIEEKLAEVIENRFFVAGIPDEVLGEKLILIIEDNVTSSAVEKSSISVLNKIKNLSTLTNYEIPKKIAYIPKFVETDTKKIQRILTLDLIL